MKKSNLLLIHIIILCLLSCSTTDGQINKYVQHNCSFEVNDTCLIDLRKALNIDYDTMWLFNEFTILDAMQNCLNSKTFIPKRPFKPIAIEYHVYSIILLKDSKIVYNSYISRELKIQGGIPITIQGVFDGNTMTDIAYLYSSPFYSVTKDNGRYILDLFGNPIKALPQD